MDAGYGNTRVAQMIRTQPMRLQSFVTLFLSAVLGLMRCATQAPSPAVAIQCQAVSEWCEWLAALRPADAWSGIADRVRLPGKSKRLSPTSEITILERVPPEGLCDCCVVISYRRGILESISIT